MITPVFGAFTLVALLALLWIFSSGVDHRLERAGWLLWLVIVFLPILSLLARGRPLYLQPAQSWATPLSSVVNPIQIFGAVLALVVCWTSLQSVQRSCKPLLVVLSFYVLVQVTSDLYNGTLGATAGPTLSLLALFAIAMRREAIGPLKFRITWLLRVYIWLSLLAYVVAPAWSVVPVAHASRTYFGLDSRFVGLSTGPNYMALVAALSFLVEIYPLNRQRGWIGSAGCSLAVCVWSQGRAAFLILAVALVAVLVARARSRDRALLTSLVLLVLPCAALLLPSVQSRVFQALSSRNIDEITTGRTEAWSLAWTEFIRSPLIGRGSSVFGTQYWNEGAAGRGGTEFANAHNQFLQAMAQGGIMGLVATMLLLGCLIQLAGRAARHTRGFSIALLAVIITQLAFGTPLRSAGFSANLILLSLCVAVLVSSVEGSEDGVTRAKAGRLMSVDLPGSA